VRDSGHPRSLTTFVASSRKHNGHLQLWYSQHEAGMLLNRPWHLVIQTLTTYFSKICFNIIFLYPLRSPRWSLSMRFQLCMVFLHHHHPPSQCLQYGSSCSILTQCAISSPSAEKAPPKVDNHDIICSNSLFSITSLSSLSFLEEYTGIV